MKPGLILSVTLISAMLALPAMADPVVPDDVLTVQAPSLSESKAAEADWYRQFAQPKPADAKPVWQPDPPEFVAASARTDAGRCHIPRHAAVLRRR